MNREIASEELYRRLLEGAELALLDVREQGAFAQGHLLQASCLPLSRFELLIGQMVRCRNTPVVLTGDQNSGRYRLLERATACLEELGYSDVVLLKGGNEEWQQAGYPLFTGINTLSKAFGEFVEYSCGTPRISPQELRNRIQAGEDLKIFDARPTPEFFRNSIPNAVNLPGAELLYRFFDQVPEPDTTVVVNCAGRTRSIIGAQSLLNAGVPNRVIALENGTMGWYLAGFSLDHGRSMALPQVSPAGLAAAAEATRRLTRQFRVRSISRAELDLLQRETGELRNITLLDVRSPAEFAAGHLAGSRNAPGGQLIQATDDYIAVRNGLVILTDNDMVRATLAASWLIQMGLPEVFVLADGIGSEKLIQSQEKRMAAVKVPRISLARLQECLDSGSVLLLDLSSSREYREGHIPGAAWIIRSRLEADLRWLQTPELIVVTSGSGKLAELAGEDLTKIRPEVGVAVLDGGTSAWKAMGLPLISGLSRCMSAVEDVWYRPYERQQDGERWMRDYLDWEVGLLKAVVREESIRFSACEKNLNDSRGR
jgi:rhodanese-related sulfurtransferase